MARTGWRPWFLLAAFFALAYLLLFTYGICRPSVESLFIEAHGSEGLPAVWVGVALTSLFAVVAYVRVVARVPLLTVFVGSIVASAGLLGALLGLRALGAPGTDYVLYLWKDVYIVVLVESFWILANLVFTIQRARWSYGPFLLAGSLGSITAELAVGWLAERFSTEAALASSLPVFALCAVIVVVLGRMTRATEAVANPPSAPPTLRESVSLFRRSDYLIWLAVLICLVQFVITLVDYEYNVVFESAFPKTDERTKVFGQVYAAINTGSFVLQALAGPVLRLAAVPLTLLGVPVLLGGTLAGWLAVGGIAMTASSKVASKVLDYSLFKAGKEILYIPLTYEEKTRGKAVVDMLVYRVAKIGPAAIVTGLLWSEMGDVVLYVTLGLVGAWFLVTLRIVRRYRGRVSRDEELGRVAKTD
jgi:AAA family ATP:ADP antiporter